MALDHCSCKKAALRSLQQPFFFLPWSARASLQNGLKVDGLRYPFASSQHICLEGHRRLVDLEDPAVFIRCHELDGGISLLFLSFLRLHRRQPWREMLLIFQYPGKAGGQNSDSSA